MFFLTSGHLEISFGCYGVLDGDGPQLGKVIGSVVAVPTLIRWRCVSLVFLYQRTERREGHGRP